MFKTYTGCEYLMIDAATHFGLSKSTFEDRINWCKTNLNNLESLLPQAEEKALFLKAVYAIRDTQAGIPTGHLVELDSCASGLQIMSTVMGCYTGAKHTGLIDSNVMPDAYKTCTGFMQEQLGYAYEVERKDAKQALMCYMYGSEAEPKNIFTEGTAPYKEFFEAARRTAPEAYDLRNILIDAWQPFASTHSWKLPDGFDAVVKVMTKKETVIKVPELNSSFTHHFTINEGQERGLSLAANVIHSIDGMIVREMNRRCNYDEKKLIKAKSLIHSSGIFPLNGNPPKTTKFISVNQIETLNSTNIHWLGAVELLTLDKLIDRVLTESKPFELVCIHDAFKAHPNNMDAVRYWYKEILAELADSTIMEDLLKQVYGNPSLQLTRASNDLGKYIRESNYAIA